MSNREFRDFVSARGENLIHTWLHSKEVSAKARAAINVQLEVLKSVRTLERPAAGFLTRGECRGLIEIRVKVDRVQYRPLAYYGPEDGQVTLLVGAREKGDEFDPPNACTTAHERIKQLQSGRATTREHDAG